MTITLNTKFGAALVITLSLGACAKNPDSIAATYVSAATYTGLRCNELAQENMRLSSVLARASTQQENARTNDVLGIIFIGIPVSSLSGDNIAPEIARLKGEQEALNRRMLDMNCSSDSEVKNERPQRQATRRPQSLKRSDYSAKINSESDILPAREFAAPRQQRQVVDIQKVMMQGVSE